ncbi:MAG: 3-deoxy-D-manno-octulosonic acid transferase [Bacteroidales bacterium]|nr:3-deoxy-D-manno-octulosonic acid transferase [Bacteroidales bacterium]
MYNLGIIIYTALAHLISPFNKKARLYIKGRIGWEKNLAEKINHGDKYIWIHCASLGEFEQGRPVIEKVKKEMPHFKIILTFFSPSGYEIRKNYQLADIICYLPYDTPGNAEKFISLIDPGLVIFVKYEFWYNYISVLKRKNIPLYLISGIFRKEQQFFKWYGSFFRQILKMFSRIFVQDMRSFDLLRGIGIENVSLAGDTRFDRVMQIAGNAKDIIQIERFRGEEKLFLAGSSWKQDEEIISQYINRYPDKMKWVFAPHEIDINNIERLEKLIRIKHVRFSQFSEDFTDARVMIIDNIGMLSSAYRYAYIAAVGGGFGKGIHNILEPACWGIPVLFGPNHEKFREAADLLSIGGAKSFNSYDSFKDALDIFLDNKILYSQAAEAAGDYVKENTGATGKIMQGIV